MCCIVREASLWTHHVALGAEGQRHVRSKHTTALNWINHEVACCHVQYHDASINDIQSVDY